MWLLTVVLTKAIVTPIIQIKDSMNLIANGLLKEADGTITYRSKDELGVLAHAARKVIRFFRTCCPAFQMCAGITATEISTVPARITIATLAKPARSATA